MADISIGTVPDSSVTTAKLADLAVTNAKVATAADIAKSKIATAGTWVLADLPALTQRGSTLNSGRTISTTSTTFVNLATLTITPSSATNVCIVHGGVIGVRNNTGGNSVFGRVAFGANNGGPNGINQVTAGAGQASPLQCVGVFKDQAAALTTVALQWRVDGTTGDSVFSGTANESDYVECVIIQQ